MPYEKAKTTLGEKLFDQARQYSWMGDGAFIMHDILENRTMVQCVISGVEKEPSQDRERTLTRDVLTEALQPWLDGPIAKGAMDVRPAHASVVESD